MGTRNIQDYFTPQYLPKTLESYGSFAKGAAWSIGNKMDLYSASQQAFNQDLPEPERLSAFELIYDNLVKYWQVFRPQGPKRSWPPEQIYATLCREFAPYSKACGMTLPVFYATNQYHDIMFSLQAMIGIKPNREYPTMTVSKFLHFYNPGLFPIYDNEVIWNRVFSRFKRDYSEFCAMADLPESATGAGFLRNYICWAGSLVTSSGPEFMNIFITWLRDNLPPRDFNTMDIDGLKNLYATAFEFTVIGAAVAEG